MRGDDYESVPATGSAGQSVPRRVYDDYGAVLVGVVVSLIIVAASGDRVVGKAFGILILAAIFMLTLRASSVSRRGMLLAAFVVIPVVVASIVAVALQVEAVADGTSLLISVLFVVASPIVIIRRLAQHSEVSRRTVMGALCLYLFAGLFFALVYGLISWVQEGAFFAQEAEPASVDFVYFSLTSLTTLGFGDLSAASSAGRMVSVMEAIFGQLYLVTVVALLVGNLGRSRRRANED